MSLIDDNWEKLFDSLNIEQEIHKNGLFYITADQIRVVKEPRLMTKFDTKESLPGVFQNKYGILPVERGKYVIGEFELFHDFPESKTEITRISSTRVEENFETIDLNDIRSEAGAINIMNISGILEDFLSEPSFYQTVSGRMGSGCFSFEIAAKDQRKRHDIEVKNSQIEIDAGFENKNVFAILEGKNVIHNNFLIRQLYYPLRLWREKIRKDIRPVFMVYSNQIFRLLEYRFLDHDLYNSIELVQEKNYSLEDIDISWKELRDVFMKTVVRPEPDVTFIQADSFNKVISLAEHLDNAPLTSGEIAEVFGFRSRQSDYYFNACKYLGLVSKRKDPQGNIRAYLTDMGRSLQEMNYKERQLAYVGRILEHRVFYDLFETVLRMKELPDKKYIMYKMKEQQVCGDSLISRRASSVQGWLRWMMQLVQMV